MNTAPALITILFRVTDEGVAMLYLRGSCEETQTFSVVHEHDCLPFPSRPLGNGMVLMLPVSNGDGLIITVSNHYGQVLGCAYGEVNSCLVQFDKILSLTQDSDLAIKQGDVDEEKIVNRALQRALDSMFGEVA